MKKNVFIVAALLFAGTTFAQTETDVLTSERGEPILPVAGDYGLGFDASNIFNFVGNMFNGTQNNSLNGLGFQNDQTIYGKYFVEDQKAYRVMLRLGHESNTDRTIVTDLTPGAAIDATVENKTKTSETNISVGGGIESRRGTGRLQGVYGPVAIIGYGSGEDKEYTYGNTLENEGGTRTLEENTGGNLSLSVGAFGGIEYFIAPKFSLGAEIMWTIGYSNTGDGEVVKETYNIDGTTTTTTTEIGGESSIEINTTPATNISVNFYF